MSDHSILGLMFTYDRASNRYIGVTQNGDEHAILTPYAYHKVLRNGLPRLNTIPTVGDADGDDELDAGNGQPAENDGGPDDPIVISEREESSQEEDEESQGDIEEEVNDVDEEVNEVVEGAGRPEIAAEADGLSVQSSASGIFVSSDEDLPGNDAFKGDSVLARFREQQERGRLLQADDEGLGPPFGPLDQAILSEPAPGARTPIYNEEPEDQATDHEGHGAQQPLNRSAAKRPLEQPSESPSQAQPSRKKRSRRPSLPSPSPNPHANDAEQLQFNMVPLNPNPSQSILDQFQPVPEAELKTFKTSKAPVTLSQKVNYGYRMNFAICMHPGCPNNERHGGMGWTRAMHRDAHIESEHAGFKQPEQGTKATFV
ncbi:hypothetical protein E4T38_06541 [Aureobasidium subglaciale]|nr:hypothetical protein E4T38_06541 [Aureobasidium subglaciale]KAI5218986.1 hypothetical protein E4T40_06660 [Aureobasidium subglaciale]KAI5222714.1 hypothetical protein E4T41_06481 [Aureobasidium subglaciale]KAI5260263.1 hypothetical protein E4T46_06193 [Aureobasidium subglaciale]